LLIELFFKHFSGYGNLSISDGKLLMRGRMRRIVLCLLFMSLMVFPSAAVEEASAPLNQVDEINYSLGYQLGRELLASGVELRPEALYQALYDAQAEADPELKKMEMTVLLEMIRGEEQ
jgi:hypothetical protein